MKYNPLFEITLRKYERPDSSISEREHLKLLCLSFGLLQPGDSRDVIVDILKVLMDARTKREMLDISEIQKRVIDYRKKNNLELLGVAQSNIRRQIRRMRELMIVEKIKNEYRITEFLELKELLDEKLIKYLIPSVLSRLRDLLERI